MSSFKKTYSVDSTVGNFDRLTAGLFNVDVLVVDTLNANDINATNVNSTDVNATDVNSTNVTATDVNSTNVTATNVNSTNGTFGTANINDYTLPLADGSAGEVVVTDGVGNLSFDTRVDGSGTDNFIPRFSGTGVKLIQDSRVVVDDQLNLYMGADSFNTVDLNNNFTSVIFGSGNSIGPISSSGAIIGTLNSAISGDIHSGIYSCFNCAIGGGTAGRRNSITSGENCVCSGFFSSITSSINSGIPTLFGSVILGSNAVTSVTNVAVCGGFVFGTIPSTANRKWELSSGTGVGTFEGGTSVGPLLDYAEFYENDVDAVIPTGCIVTLNGSKVRLMNSSDDYLLGVISKTAGITLGDTPFGWKGHYCRDEWGECINESGPMPDWVPEPGQTMDDAPTISVPAVDPKFDPTQKNIPRKDRPNEWSCVGIMGQVKVRCDDTPVVNKYVKSDDNGCGTLSETKTRLRAMKIEQSYDSDKGYAIVLCNLI